MDAGWPVRASAVARLTWRLGRLPAALLSGTGSSGLPGSLMGGLVSGLVSGLVGGLVGALLATWPVAALAERADRGKPMTLESDQPCVVNLQKQTSVCSGNVVVSQGTLQLRAERLELRETAEGYQQALAVGSDGKPARFRQKRDGVDETVEGQGSRIQYDSRTGVLRFDGQALVRRLRGIAVADEIQGASIVWDSLAEQFSVQGGTASPANPTGRVRAVITPRLPPEEPGTAASAPATGLRQTPVLGDRR